MTSPVVFGVDCVVASFSSGIAVVTGSSCSIVVEVIVVPAADLVVVSFVGGAVDVLLN